MNSVQPPKKRASVLLTRPSTATTVEGSFVSPGAIQVIKGAVLLTIAVSLSALAGLLTQNSLLTRWVSASNSMGAEAAAASLIAGAGLWLALHRKGWPIVAIAGVLQVLGWTNLIFASPLFAPDSNSFLAASGIRMAPGTAVTFIMAESDWSSFPELKSQFQLFGQLAFWVLAFASSDC